MSKQVTSGSGIRRGIVWMLNSDGLPRTGDASANLIQGSLVEKISSMTTTDPEPRRINHLGADRAYAQDSLPSQEVGTFQINMGATNLKLATQVEGTKVKTIAGRVVAAGGNTNKKGNEPQIGFAAFRQSLDTEEGSATFGQLRQWEMRIYGSARVVSQSPSFEGEATDNIYSATPTPVRKTPWNEYFSEDEWGFTESEYVKMNFDYQPIFCFGKGDGTLTAFNLPFAPKTSSHLLVWTNGTLQTPSNVDTSVATPSFTLSGAVAVDAPIFAIVETEEAIPT